MTGRDPARWQAYWREHDARRQPSRLLAGLTGAVATALLVALWGIG